MSKRVYISADFDQNNGDSTFPRSTEIFMREKNTKTAMPGHSRPNMAAFLVAPPEDVSLNQFFL